MNAALAPRLTSLEAIERARELLAHATKLEDVKAIADSSHAARELLRRKQKGSEAHAEAWALVQEASRRLGELTLAMPKAKTGPKTTEVISPPTRENLSKSERIAELKITSQQVSEAERAAKLTEEEFAARKETGMQRIRDGKRAKPITATTAASTYDSDAWETPARYVEAAREALGGSIDLDPASNAFAQNTIRASRFNTKQDSGLVIPWQAKTVWLNPPFSRKLVAAFTGHFAGEYERGHFEAGIVLVNSATETEWYQLLVGCCTAMCLPDHRIAFELQGRPIDQNLYCQTFFYAGKDLRSFVRVFGQFGRVLMPITGAA